MAWSIVEFDSLHILYTDPQNTQYLIRKSSASAREIEGSSNVSLIVDTHVYVWNIITHTIRQYSYWPQNALRQISVPWSDTLKYTEAITPIATSANDLIQKIYELLRAANVKVEVNGTYIGQQSTVNFTEGDSVFISATADTVNDKINVVISSDETPKMLMLMGG